jgi:hypothetical protein
VSLIGEGWRQRTTVRTYAETSRRDTLTAAREIQNDARCFVAACGWILGYCGAYGGCAALGIGDDVVEDLEDPG